MKRIGLVALACLAAPAVFAAAGNIPGHGGGGPGDQETEHLGGLRFFVGANYNWVQLHISDTPQEHYNLQFADMRVGYRLFKSLAIEAHAGTSTRGTDGVPGRARLTRYEGVFVVPTAVVFDAFEVGFPVGFNWSAATLLSAGPVTQKQTINSVAFGINAEFPIRVLNGDLPDVRLVAGGMAYSVHSSRQAYGFRAGLRYDFDLGGGPPPPPTEGAPSPDTGAGESGAAPAAESGAAAGAAAGGGAGAPTAGESSPTPTAPAAAGTSAAPAAAEQPAASAPASAGSAAAPAPASSAATPPAPAGSSAPPTPTP